MLDLSGKTALVTGAGRGIGLGIARVLGRQGAALLINDLFEERAREACTQLQQEGFTATALPFDTTDYEAVSKAVKHCDGIDILVNNAGIPGQQGMQLQAFADTSPETWRPMVDVNLYGTFNCTHAVLSGMRSRGWGRILVVSSDAGRVGTSVGASLYGACKAAAVHFIRNLSQEVADDGITANAIALGPMDNLPEEIVDYVVRGLPIKRLGSGEDAGNAIAYLASEEASWVTGQLLPVNGGLTPT